MGDTLPYLQRILPRMQLFAENRLLLYSRVLFAD